jgi:hypothetical protein
LSINWQTAEPSPALVTHPPAASLDEAHAAIELWEHYSRKTLDGVQRLAVEHMMAEKAGGTWAARTTGRAVSRQNGKGDEIEVVEAWDLIQRGAPIVHSAHEIPTAKSAHLRLVGLLEGHRDLRRRIKRIRYANGDQSIEMLNGGIIVYRTRTAGGGRGLDDIARLVIDEAQHAQPEHLASATPILAVNPNPQTNVMGSAGIANRSMWWWSLRKRALAGGVGEFAWLEHSAESISLNGDGQVVSIRPDSTDVASWVTANPALPSRIPFDFLAEQLRILGPELFAREHLCVWDPLDPEGLDAVFGAGKWKACEISDRPPDIKIAALSIAVSFELTHGAIGAAGLHNDEMYVKPLQHGKGTTWMVDRVKQLQNTHDVDVVIDGKGPAAVLIPDLEEADVRLHIADTANVLDACAGLFDLVQEGQVWHEGYAELDAAVAGAVKRTVGDRWAWGRKTSTADISTLEAITLAAWWAEQSANYELLDSIA